MIRVEGWEIFRLVQKIIRLLLKVAKLNTGREIAVDNEHSQDGNMVKLEKTENSIHHDLQILAPISKVYEAVTEPSHLINWWPQECSGKPETGEVYNFVFTPEYNWYAKVIEASPPNKFHVKMTKSDSDWDPTSFGFNLQQHEASVQVEFRHVGWPSCNANFRRSSYCWAILLKGLKDYLEKGVIVPFEERE